VSFLIVMVLLLVVMYVLMIRPQRQRQRDQQSMVDGAGVGDDILTTGGIYGTITRAEGDDVVVEIGDETKVNVHMTRRGIAAVLPPEDDTAPETIDAEAVEEPDDDESAVTTREEAVTSGADAEAAAADRR
jgi:preprotein translocase subunit YajC